MALLNARAGRPAWALSQRPRPKVSHLESRAVIAPCHPYPNPDPHGSPGPASAAAGAPPTPPPPLLPPEEGSWLAAVVAEASVGAIWE